MQILADGPKVSGRSNGLDALRAVLALWVVTVHLFPGIEILRGTGSASRFGLHLVSFVTAVTQTTWELNSAVIVFIVLSGYCIHRSGFRDDRRDIKAYAVRRATRILPIFYFALFVGLVVGGYETQPPSLACIISHATTLSALTSEYASCQLGNGPLATVTVEILLYALYALAFWLLVWRGKERWIWRAIGLAALIGIIVAARESANPAFYNWWQNLSLLGFIPFWWIGAAFVNSHVSDRLSRWLPVWILAYVATTGAVLALTNFQAFGPDDVPLLASLISQVRALVLAVLAGILIVKLENVKIGSRNPLAVLGRASYSLYALHSPINYFLITRGAPWFVVMAANICAALTSYVLIERRGIVLGKLYLSGQLTGGAAPAKT
jgi:peptidoglycan/LPS O-acetylase OafA/YrhL